MDKLLYISNIGGVTFNVGFCGTSMEACKKLEIEYHVVANRSKSNPQQMESDEREYGIHLYHADIHRFPLSQYNRKAYYQILEIIRKEGIDFIHCNTPVGGLLGRLCGKRAKVPKIIYTAHGFHFYKGAPLLNWLLYYPAERWLAHYTDALITINREDYAAAQKFRLRRGGRVYYVPGVGVDTDAFSAVADVRSKLLEEQKIPADALLLLSSGELNTNKNNESILRALHELQDPSIHYLICGVGDLETPLKALTAALGLESQVHFLGYRSDMKELLRAADIFVMPSLREGLSRSLMEAMASGLPCLVSRIRGNVDLIEDGVGGYLYAPSDSKGFAEGIRRLLGSPELRVSMGQANLKTIQKYDVRVVEKQIEDIYREVLQA